MIAKVINVEGLPDRNNHIRVTRYELVCMRMLQVRPLGNADPLRVTNKQICVGIAIGIWNRQPIRPKHRQQARLFK